MSSGYQDDLIGFPPGSWFVVTPQRPIRASRNGLVLYTASEFHQLLAEMVGRSIIASGFGRLLRRTTPPIPDPDWWNACLNEIAPDISRNTVLSAFRLSGDDFGASVVASLLMTEDGTPAAFVKLTPLRDEQPSERLHDAVLRHLDEHRPQSFSVPRLLNTGTYEGFRFLVQSALPEGRHRRIGRKPELVLTIIEEIHQTLDPLKPATTPPHYVLSHGSLGRSNARFAGDGRIWVFDWDGIVTAPSLNDDIRYWTSELGPAPGSPQRKARTMAGFLRLRGTDSDIREALEWRRAFRAAEHHPRAQAVRRALEEIYGIANGPSSAPSPQT